MLIARLATAATAEREIIKPVENPITAPQTGYPSGPPFASGTSTPRVIYVLGWAFQETAAKAGTLSFLDAKAGNIIVPAQKVEASEEKGPVWVNSPSAGAPLGIPVPTGGLWALAAGSAPSLAVVVYYTFGV